MQQKYNIAFYIIPFYYNHILQKKQYISPSDPLVFHVQGADTAEERETSPPPGKPGTSPSPGRGGFMCFCVAIAS